MRLGTSVLPRITNWDAWVEQFWSNVLSNDFPKHYIQWKLRWTSYPYAVINISSDPVASGTLCSCGTRKKAIFDALASFLKNRAKLPTCNTITTGCNRESQANYTGNIVGAAEMFFLCVLPCFTYPWSTEYLAPSIPLRIRKFYQVAQIEYWESNYEKQRHLSKGIAIFCHASDVYWDWALMKIRLLNNLLDLVKNISLVSQSCSPYHTA